MSQKIQMILSNNQTYKQTFKYQPSLVSQPNIAPAPAPIVSKNFDAGFNGPMIGRIHTIKPGCGSCGR